MKVLHLSSEKSWRGGEQQIAYLIEELNKLNVHNFVACKKNSDFENYCKRFSIKHITLSFSGSFDISTAIKIKNFCTNNKIDILHMHSGNSHSIGVISSLLGNKSKLILSRRVDFPVKNNWFSRFKFNYKKIAKIICVSEAIKELIMPSIKDHRKLTVVHSGIDMNRFINPKNNHKLHNEFNINERIKIVANVSALAPHKDHITFVKTAKQYLNNGGIAKFFIIGDGPCKNEIIDYIRRLKLEDDIILTGFRSDIPEILTEINAFLITSCTEGLGTTVLDAMANKVPVIATAAGGIPEMIKHKKTGMLYHVNDFKGLADGIQAVLADDDLRNKIITNAYKLVSSEFTKEQTALNTFKIYSDLAVGEIH